MTEAERERIYSLEKRYASSPSNPGQDEAYQVSSGYPSGVSDLPKSQFIPPATTLYANEAEPGRVEDFNRYWRIHSGFGWSRKMPQPHLDEVERGHQINTAIRDISLNIEPVLDIVPYHLRSPVRNRFYKVNKKRFSAHYRGIYGACIGSAFVEIYPDLETLRSSTDDPFYKDACDYCDSLEIDVDALAKFAFKVWGDDDE